MAHKPYTDVAAYAEALGELEQTLRKHRYDFWADKIQSARQAAEKLDSACIRRFLACLGGMGSLNDIILDDADDHSALQAQISRAYRQATALKKV